MSSLGDWICGACRHMNFKKRDLCQKCGFSKYCGYGQLQASSTAPANKAKSAVLAGDWYCQAFSCGAHNYASRVTCYRCTAMKPECTGGVGAYVAPEGVAVVVPGWKTGDWICSRLGCGEHNYAYRMGCYKCKTPRDCGEKSSYSSS